MHGAQGYNACDRSQKLKWPDRVSGWTGHFAGQFAPKYCSVALEVAAALEQISGIGNRDEWGVFLFLRTINFVLSQKRSQTCSSSNRKISSDRRSLGIQNLPPCNGALSSGLVFLWHVQGLAIYSAQGQNLEN